MKTINIIYTIILSCAMVGFNSCQLAEEIDDYEPLFALASETALDSQTNAELGMIGIYSAFSRSGAASGLLVMAPSGLSGYLRGPIFASGEYFGIVEHTLNTEDLSSIPEVYSSLYGIIANCNWLIQGVTDNLTEADFNVPSRRQEIIAEAKVMRALSHYYLLQFYGQWYDLNSTYGVTIKNEFTTSSEALPRNTVAEVYDFILSDLNDGIADAPNNGRTKNYINSVFAKALKARVKLHMGDYAEASTLAQEIITNSGNDFALSSTYAEIFDTSSDALYNTSEALFISSAEGSSYFYTGLVSDLFLPLNPDFYDFATTESFNINGQLIDYDSDRISTIFQPGLNAMTNEKYAGFSFGAIYHMRMAEVYLILAEADARANSSVTSTALDALNAIRIRVGATTTGGNGFETYPATIGYDDFLEAVRLEKVIELTQETGTDWYDLVRYAYIDGGFDSGFKISDVNPLATNPNKFIFPIDPEAIKAGGNVVDQNPGY